MACPGTPRKFLGFLPDFLRTRRTLCVIWFSGCHSGLEVGEKNAQTLPILAYRLLPPPFYTKELQPGSVPVEFKKIQNDCTFEFLLFSFFLQI